MKLAIVAITKSGLNNAQKLKKALPDSTIYAMKKLGTAENDEVKLFDRKVSELTPELFEEYDGLVMCMALGIVIRVIAPLVRSKYSDPAVVVVDEAARYAISALSGHEGGANELAIKVANALNAEPVITTASESARNIVIGVGCRRGVKKEEVIDAVTTALNEAGHSVDDVRAVATIDIKRDEVGLCDACSELGLPLRIISTDMVKRFNGEYQRSEFVNKKIGIKGVCEPCAILTASAPKMIMQKKIFGNVTIAIVKENFASSV